MDDKVLQDIADRVRRLEEGDRAAIDKAIADAADDIARHADRVASNARVRMLVTLAGAFFGSAAAALAWEFFRRFGLP